MNNIWGRGLENVLLFPYLTDLQFTPDPLITLFYLLQILLSSRLFDTHILFLYTEMKKQYLLGWKREEESKLIDSLRKWDYYIF